MEFNGNYTVQVRSERIAVKEVGDELAVYDLDTDRVHLLNATTARIWKACQEPVTVRRIGEVIGDGAPADEVQEVVAHGLIELRQAGLLTEASFLPPGVVPMSRRSLLKKAGLAALAIPVITTIAAPPAAAQASSCTAAGGTCTATSQCCATLTCNIDPGQTTGVCGPCVAAGDSGCTGTTPAGCCNPALPCTQISAGTRKCCKASGTCTADAQCCSGNCLGGGNGNCQMCKTHLQSCGGSNGTCCPGSTCTLNACA